MKVQEGQNLADIAIQEYGCLEAVVDLACANGISVTQSLVAGMDLVIPQKRCQGQMMAFCKSHSVQPATVHDQSGVRLGLFSDQFSNEFQ